jgi:isopenicillin-N N-acyltransferase-like protein
MSPTRPSRPRRTATAPRPERRRPLARPPSPARQRLKRWLIRLLALLVVTPLLAHLVILAVTGMGPPRITPPRTTARPAADDPTRRELGASWARKRGQIHEVRLVGDPLATGHAHGQLLYEQQVAIEGQLHEQFAHFVPWAPARWLLVDLARLQFRGLDQRLSLANRTEIAAQAAAFSPDPFSSMMGTYQRFVFLESLYDIMLSFEQSPLVGCSSFVATGERTAGGRTLLGRNFDFEGPQVLDDEKAVFLMLEAGHIPYASVAWPGFVGTTTGLNLAGLGIVIHGARAGEPRSDGEPVAQTVRDLLGGALNVDEALAQLTRRPPMVPHMLLLADASGAAAVVERIPGHPLHIRRRSGPTMALSNHLEGPLAGDPKNHAVIAKTSTTIRRQRLDEILQNVKAPIDVQRAVEILRDKRAVGGGPLPLGHRAAIDALIATHSVVMDITDRVLWVGEGPHAAGRFLRFDLVELLGPSYRPSGPTTVEALPADDILNDDRYDEWVQSGSPHAKPR